MRSLRSVSALLVWMFLVPLSWGQPLPPATIKKVDVGFLGYRKEGTFSIHKVGLWTPVFVEVEAGPRGLDNRTILRIETPDSEEVGTIYEVPIQADPNLAATYIGYIKTGTQYSDIRVSVVQAGRTLHSVSERSSSTDLHSVHVLTLGSKIADFNFAVGDLTKQEQAKLAGQFPNGVPEKLRFGVHETDFRKLPEHWFAYEGIDLLLLSTSNANKFLEQLQLPTNLEKLRAISQWVRRGGHLVIPVSPSNQELLNKVLTSPAWAPAIPVVPPAADALAQTLPVKRLAEVESWGNVPNKPFPNPGEAKPMIIASLDSGQVRAGDWQVFAKTADNRPLISQLRYGFGSITYFAFSLEDPLFQRWDGRVEFMQRMIERLGPRTRNLDPNQEMVMRGQRVTQNDLTTDLLRTMDLFDIQAIDFKWVALFILLYIVLAGPVEFLVLRYVFKRMELTWITFPTMVLAISVLAYFAAFALKGQDLRINKVDIVDFDLRTELNELRKTRKAFASGTTFFTILSPQIKSYTMGVEANPAFWQGTSKEPISADMITWAGRPDGDAWAMRRGGGGGGGGLFRMPYQYVRDASGLEGVPIPVWTSKSMVAKWETPLNKLPFQADLRYFGDRSQKIKGQIVNNLGVDLVDAWLIYSDNCYSIQGGLPMAKNQPEAKDLALNDRALCFSGWLSEPDECDQKRPTFPTGFYNPTTTIKQLCFLQRLDTTSMLGNHSLRPLDWGWRIQEERGLLNDTTTREAILFARVQPKFTDLTALENDVQPTKLWLDRLPVPGNTRDPLVGYGNQDTFIRVILPVLPSEK